MNAHASSARKRTNNRKKVQSALRSRYPVTKFSRSIGRAKGAPSDCRDQQDLVPWSITWDLFAWMSNGRQRALLLLRP